MKSPNFCCKLGLAYEMFPSHFSEKDEFPPSFFGWSIWKQMFHSKINEGLAQDSCLQFGQ